LKARYYSSPGGLYTTQTPCIALYPVGAALVSPMCAVSADREDDSTNYTVTSRAVDSSWFLVFLCLRTMDSFNPRETDYYKELL
jgi:hypothetical protein